jgi:hypothetical protein
MNPFLLRTEDRLAHWKNFRKSLPLLDEMTQFTSVAEYWSKAPLVSIAYDSFDATTWPTPWEMIRNNEWCRNSVAIGMENTLRLAGFPSNRMTLTLIIDRDIQEILLILIVDRKWVLNYDWGMVLAYPRTDHSVLKTWKFGNKAYSSSR